MSEISQEDKLLHAVWVEAVAKVNAYIQKFPGDGFTHEAQTKGPGGPAIYAVPGIVLTPLEVCCPCYNQIYIERPFRWDGEVDVIECPRCHFWHVITWRVSRPEKKRNCLFPPARKKA